MNVVAVAPIVLPLLVAALSALWRGRRGVQRTLAIATVAIVGAVGIVLTWRATTGSPVITVIGGSDARYRIALVADAFGSSATVAVAFVGLAALITMALRADDHHPLMVPAVLVLLAGVWGTFMTGDLFNLFVFFEVALVASYVLLVVGGTTAQARAGAVYVTVNLLGSLVFLAGVGLLYGATGTVNLAVLATDAPRPAVREVAEAVILAAFALKAALLPLAGWLRLAYPVAPRTVAALFAAVLTTVGAVAIYRVVPVAFAVDGARTALMYLALSTVLGAGLAALAVPGVWRMASLIVMAQAGLMVVGIGLDGSAGTAAGMTFVVQDIVAKGALFLALASTADIDTEERELVSSRPVLSAVLILLLGSLAGLPLTSGFVGKALIVRAAFDGGEVVLGALVLTGSLLVLAAGCRILRETIWTAPDVKATAVGPSIGRLRWAVVPAAVLAGLIVITGIVPAWLDDPVNAAATLLSDPAMYAEEVLR